MAEGIEGEGGGGSNVESQIRALGESQRHRVIAGGGGEDEITAGDKGRCRRPRGISRGVELDIGVEGEERVRTNI